MHEIVRGVYYTGVLNPNMRVFDVVMRTEYGTSYNSYLVKGADKTAAIEAAHLVFSSFHERNLEEALDGRSIDYLVLNHCEPDHTGGVARLLKKYPEATVVVSQAGAIYIRQIANNPDIKLQIVKDGDKIDLGGRTLEFINAPFLHWPDSMFTWLPEDGILFSCDFLGAHYCEPQIYDYNVAYDEQYTSAMRYYFDCIFAPFAPYVQKGLAKIKDLDIAFCCNSHGPILTKGCMLREVMECYDEWSKPRLPGPKSIPIFYVTAYGNTKLLAESIAEGVREVIPDAQVSCYNIIEHDLAGLAALMNESDAFLIGSPTINRDAVAPVWQLLGMLEAVGIQKRPVALFGSYGWSGEAVGNLAQRLTGVKCNVFEDNYRVVLVPTKENLCEARKFGMRFAKTLA